MKKRKMPLSFYLTLFIVAMTSTASLMADTMQEKEYKKPTASEIKAKLTRLQFDVTQNSGTETPFENEYWNNHEAGIYVDRVSGEPLFSSEDKYDSGTGWPSFSKPLEKGNITSKVDYKLLFKRTEVRSKIADSHLGHVFDDGPAPSGLRYCMNSAALRFIPAIRLKEEGYEQYLQLFANKIPTGAPKPLVKEIATFAGGCFWSMQHPFDEVPGVLSATVGYTGGLKMYPTYSEVSSGTTGHAESIQIEYDSSKISYENLLDIYWKNVDPLDDKGQFCDKGDQYRTEIFFHDEKQRQLAERSLEKIRTKLGKNIATKMGAASMFYPAEKYHQSYYRKNPIRYKLYRWNCGRDTRLNVLKKLLGD